MILVISMRKASNSSVCYSVQTSLDRPISKQPLLPIIEERLEIIANLGKIRFNLEIYERFSSSSLHNIHNLIQHKILLCKVFYFFYNAAF